MAEVSKLNIALGIILIGSASLGWIGGKSIEKVFEDTDANTRSIIEHEQRLTSAEERQEEDRAVDQAILVELKKLSDSSIRQEEQLKRLELTE